MHRAIAFGVSVLLLGLLASWAPGSEHGKPESRVVIGVSEQANVETVATALRSRGYVVTRELSDIRALEIAVGRADESAREIARMPGVRYAEPVSALVTADTPGDPYFRDQGYLNAVNAPAAWNIEQGRREIVVAVIDTGVDIRHPDLAANIWTNPFEVPNNGADDDANGCVDDVNGCAFVSDSLPGCPDITNGFINDDIGHGTFVSGIIAAPANGIGIVGVARNVRVMPVKVLDCYGAGDTVAAARGILYAARNGARVINLSLGGFFEAQVVREAVDEAMRFHGAVVVAASGNSGTPGVSFPARINDVIAVGATNASASGRAAFSSYGPEVDVVAVGEDVAGTLQSSRCFVLLPCLGGDPYAVGSGTSFSAPQVSGLVALMLSARPELTPWQVSDMIRATAVPLPDGTATGWDGAGRVNMLAAVEAARNDRPAGDPCVVESVIDGESFRCVGGRHVRLLQMDAPNLDQCGGGWAHAALQYIFLTPGRTVYLRGDVVPGDEQGRTLAAPYWRGNDGGDYNLAIVMVYVGLARAADIGAGNVAYRDWALAAQQWATTAQWNMWAPGKTFNGGC